MKIKNTKVLILFMIFSIIFNCFSNVKAAKYSTYINEYPVTSYTEDKNTLKDMTTLNDGEVDVNKSVEYNNGSFNINLMAEGKSFVTNLTEESEYNIVFILDNSGSMYNTPSRIKGSTEAINQIIRDLSPYGKINIAVVAYGSVINNQPAGSLPADTLLNLGHYNSTSSTQKFIEYIDNWDSSKSEIYSTDYFLNRCLKVVTSQNSSRNGFIYSAGGTFTQAGIVRGYEVLNNASNKDTAKPVIILMSDGEATGMTWTKNGDPLKDYKWEIQSISDLVNKYSSGTYGYDSFTTNSIMPYVTIRTAIYLKNKLNQSYVQDCNFYTFGYDISPDYYYSLSTLNPTKNNIDALKNFMQSGYEQYGLYSLVYNSELSWNELMYTDGYYSNANGKSAAEIYNKILFEDSRAENPCVKSKTYLTINDTIGDGMEIMPSNNTIRMTLNLDNKDKTITLTSTNNTMYSYADRNVQVKYNTVTNEVEWKILGDYFYNKKANLKYSVSLKKSSIGEISGKTYYTNSQASYRYETSKYNPIYKGANINRNLDVSGSITLTKIPANVIVKYVDEYGNEIAEQKNIDGYIHEEYTTDSLDIEGYSLIEVPDNANGIMTEDTITVIYRYENKVNVTTKYIDWYTG